MVNATNSAREARHPRHTTLGHAHAARRIMSNTDRTLRIKGATLPTLDACIITDLNSSNATL